MNNITEENWLVFFSNYRVYGDDLWKIFPFKANFNEMRTLLEASAHNGNSKFNPKFGEILWRFPNSLTKDETTKLLQYFLLKDYHHEYENIIREFQTTYNLDITTIEFLLKRLYNLPSYYSSDETLKYPFIRKIIYAIGAQPNPYNMNTLEILLKHPDDIIKELTMHQIEKRRRLGRWEIINDRM